MRIKKKLGFSKYFSADSCLLHLNNKIATGFESGIYTGMILTDLLKTFDTVNHEILINKMEFLGFSKDIFLWFKSYLSNRKYKVILNNSLETRKIFIWSSSRICFRSTSIPFICK